jgi:hypothetical protein
LYEMPEPAPILKVPIEPKDILCPKVAWKTSVERE